jgi:Flp pilus assembly protein TadG
MTGPRLLSCTSRRPGRFAARMNAGLRRLLGLPADAKGSMALEYAVIAPAFIALLLGVLHVALIYFAQEGLETAVENSARLIMTGEAQTMVLTSGKTSYTGMTATDFKNAICSGVSGTNVAGTAVTYSRTLPPFLACDRLAVNVQIVPAGCASPTITTPTYTYTTTNGTTTLTSTGTGYGTVTCSGTWSNSSAGLSSTQGQLVIMQLAYLWPTISAPMGLNFVNQPNGNRLLLSTYVFTVENYLCSDGTTTSC